MGDVEAFLDKIEAFYDGFDNIFIGGLSLGGATAYKIGLKYPNRFKGIILYAPAIKDIKESQFYEKKLVKFLGKYFPKIQTV